EWFNVGWCPAPSLGATLQIPVEPQPRIDLPEVESGQDGKEHRGQAATPQSPGAVIVLPPQRWPTQASFRQAVVHRDAWIIDRMRQPGPVFLQAGQRLARWHPQGRVGQLGVELLPHVGYGLPQTSLWNGIRWIGQSLSIPPIQVANAS